MRRYDWEQMNAWVAGLKNYFENDRDRSNYTYLKFSDRNAALIISGLQINFCYKKYFNVLCVLYNINSRYKKHCLSI